MRGWRALLLLGGGAALVATARAGYLGWDGGAGEPLPGAGREPAAGRLALANATGEPRPGATPDAPRGAARLAPSLAGTEPDGALVVDASGAFVPTPDALDYFDYHLSALGEASLGEIVATLEHEIRARVDPPDAALGLLRQYLEYREAMRTLVETQGLDSIPLDRRLQWLRETRRRVFGPELAARLFDEEESRAREAIALRAVALDPDLSPEERAEERAALERELPEAERDRRVRATLAQRVIEREAELRASGTSEAGIRAWREAEFGPEAAARLAERDRRRAEWNARVEQYRAERDRLEAALVADDAERTAAIEALRASLFEGPERIRIEALDEAAVRSTP